MGGALPLQGLRVLDLLELQPRWDQPAARRGRAGL